MNATINKNTGVAEVVKMRKALRLLGNLTDDAAPYHQTLVLLAIAESHYKGDRLEVREVGHEVGLSSAATSRNIAALGDWHWQHRPGLQLITTRVDPMDRRRKLVVLTRKGETVMEQVMEALYK